MEIEKTLAGAIVGSLNNILVAHIEGGELGNSRWAITDSVSKLSHIHFCSNDDAARRLKQMGNRIFNTYHCSPDIDIMFSEDLPNIDVKKYTKFLWEFCYCNVSSCDNRSYCDESLRSKFVVAYKPISIIISWFKQRFRSQCIIDEYQKLKGNDFVLFHPFDLNIF
jgi:UDP-N-acetylglucosamine 2-epimerase (hydrolysing)